MCLSLRMLLAWFWLTEQNYEYLPHYESFTHLHAAYFVSWRKIFPYLCNRQCEQCNSSFICSQPQFSSHPAHHLSFLLPAILSQSCSTNFSTPTSFPLWKQRKTQKRTFCQCLTCYYCLCLDSTAYLGEIQATWKAPRSLSNAERRRWSAGDLPVLRLPQRTEDVQNWLQLPSSSFPGGFFWRRQPGKRFWKGPNGVMWLRALQARQNAPSAQLFWAL